MSETRHDIIRSLDVDTVLKIFDFGCLLFSIFRLDDDMASRAKQMAGTCPSVRRMRLRAAAHAEYARSALTITMGHIKYVNVAAVKR